MLFTVPTMLGLPAGLRAVVLALGVVAALSTGVVAVEFIESELNPSVGAAAADQAALPYDDREPIAPPANGTTVVTTQKYRHNFIVAFDPQGRVLYFDDSLDRYHDVDPAPNGTHTVEFVGAEYDGDTTHEIVRRVNLTTGNTATVYRHAVPRTDRPHRWHDVDRIDADTIAVADIARDSIFVVDTDTGERTYEWSAQAAYDLDSGGPYPHDWTHVNDVEHLPDGRFLVSLRNQDSVVFVDPDTGIDPGWTLGADDDYRILNEQHNPDYIPGDGRPAVLVADSQNDRIVEYRRTRGSWVRTWTWTDAAMAWPRDADRLPNGHTLVGDTNSGRVLEVDTDGDVVWAIDGLGVYDAERLGAGGAGGTPAPADRLGLESRRVAGSDAASLPDSVLRLLPPTTRNSVGFVAPLWLSAAGRIAALLAGASLSSLILFVVGYRLARYCRARWKA
jgi:hypothetical protein